MELSRTYLRAERYLPGLSDEGDDLDVTRMDGRVPVRFNVEGDPPADPFLISRGTWEKLGEPCRVRLTVTPEATHA